MIYDTINQCDETTESQKEKKTYFNSHFQYSQSKITGIKNKWLLKSLGVRVKLVYRKYNVSDSQVLF